jgi:hypothetical protein
MYGPFESDVVAGLISAGYMLIREYAQDNNIDLRKDLYEFALNHRANEGGYYTIENIQDLDVKRYKYNIPVMVEDTDKLPEKGKMGIWIYDHEGNNESDYWEFIEVDNMRNFMQGFISMCIAFQVDFREYVLNLPIDSNGVRYDIPSYGLREYIEEEQLLEEDEEYSDD